MSVRLYLTDDEADALLCLLHRAGQPLKTTDGVSLARWLKAINELAHDVGTVRGKLERAELRGRT